LAIKMPQVYKRKNPDYGKVPAEIMQKAVNDVQQNKKPVRQAAKEYGIHRGTLRNNIIKAARMPN
ncbi:hypothetical protein PoB_004359100, partial [Plakobranchus ocellatus]